MNIPSLFVCAAVLAAPVALAQQATTNPPPSEQATEQGTSKVSPEDRALKAPAEEQDKAAQKKAEEEAKARQLTEAQDRVVEHYRSRMQAEGKTPPEPVPVDGEQDARAAADSQQKDPSPPTAHSTPQTTTMPHDQTAPEPESTPGDEKRAPSR